MSQHATSVFEVLEQMPAWADVRPKDTAGLEAIESLVRPLSNTDASSVIQDIRAFVEQREQSTAGLDVSAMSKVFVLNRFLFAVPNDAPRDQVRFAGFIGVPVKGDRADDLWPWSLAGDNDVHLTEFFRGYAGETYLAVQEAEYFRDQFGLRNPISRERSEQ